MCQDFGHLCRRLPKPPAGGLLVLFVVGGVIEEGPPTSGMKDPGGLP